MKTAEQQMIDENGELYTPRDESEKAKKRWKTPKLRKNVVAETTKENGFDPEDTDCWGS